MSSQPYDDILKQARQLPSEEQQRLIHDLLSVTQPVKPNNGKTLGDCMQERGLIGIASGPADLSTNPEHLDGFGEDG